MKKIKPERAIELAEEFNDRFVWRSVLCRMDIPSDEAIKLAIKINSRDVWGGLILCRPDISPERALYLAKELDLWGVYQRVLGRDDVLPILSKQPLDKTIELAKKVSSSKDWETIISRPDFLEIFNNSTLEQAIELAEQLDSSNVWKLLINRSDISIEKVVGLINESNAEYLLGPVLLTRFDLPLEKAIEILEMRYYQYVDWDGFIDRYKILPEVVVEIAKRLDYDDLWFTLIKREYISSHEAIEWFWNNNNKNDDDYYFWNSFLRLKNIPFEDSLSLADSLDSMECWEGIACRDDLKEKLKSLPLKECVRIAENLDSEFSWWAVLNRLDVSLEEAIDLGWEINSIDIWRAILLLPSISAEEALLLAEKVDPGLPYDPFNQFQNQSIFVEVFLRPDMDTEKAINFCRNNRNISESIITEILGWNVAPIIIMGLIGLLLSGKLDEWK